MGGTTKKLSSGVFELNHWAPGDRMRIQVNGSNLSNVKTKIRLKVVMQGDLAGALTLKVYRNGFDQDPSLAAIGKRTLVTEWADVEAGVNPGNFGVDVHFVNHGTEITSNAEGIDNQYQDRSANIIITYEAVQGNANVEDSLLEKANTILATNAALGEPNKTMYDALADLDTAQAGMKAQMLEAGYLWSVEDDQFATEAQAATKKNEYFKVYDSMPDTQTYSIYASDSWETTSVGVDGVGFDAGDVANIITKVSYTNTSGSAKTNIIRTNSLDTEVEVNAPTDVVKHYGDAKKVTIEAVAGNSYHEYGRVAIVDIANGRIALEETAEVTQIHFTATQDEFNDITVAYDQAVELPKFSRDAVAEIPAKGKLVVKLENDVDETKADTDYLWLYQQGLVQQIRVSNNDISAGTVKATDIGVSADTTKVANDIANSIKPGAVYTAAQIEAGQVASADVVEHGVATEDKTEYIDNVVEEVISEDAKDKGSAVRIGTKYYETFEEAVTDFKSGDTIRVLKNISDSNYYDFSGKNLTLHVEEGATFTFDTPQSHGIFQTGWNNAGSTFNFEGSGKIVFAYSSAQPLVGENGSSNSTLNVKDLTIECTAAGGKLADIAHLNINGGNFKNISFNSNAKIYAGFFTEDVSDYLIEGKMIDANLDAEYPYVVTNLDKEHAKFELLRGGEYSYFSTLKGISDAATQSGDVVKFIGSNLEVITTSSNKFNVNDGVTYDLNGHTLTAQSGYAFYIGFGNKTITMKNGTINATSQLCEENSIYTFSVNAINLRISDAIREDALSHINCEVLSYDSADFFTPGETPEQYEALLTRDNIAYYYNFDDGVEKAIGMVKSGETVSIFDTLKSQVNVDLVIGNSFTIVKDENIEFPDKNLIKSKTGTVNKGTPSNNSVSYTVDESYVCQIGTTGYTTLLAGYNALGNNQTLVLLEDVTITSSVSMTTKSSGKTYTLDFNGHIITSCGNSKIYINLNSNNTNSKFYFKDSVGGGGIKKDTPDNSYTVIQQGKQGQVIIEGGLYECLGGNPFSGINTSVNFTINGGTINCSEFYENTIKGKVASGKTITLNGASYTAA